jgi:two-component system cell cycle response regulator
LSNNILSDSEIELQIARKQASDYAMAMDSLTRITHSGSDKEAIESFLQLFEMLFIPEILYYVSLTNGVSDKVYSISKLTENETVIKNRIEIFQGKYAWTKSQKGFQIKIGFGGRDFGILEVDNVKFPEHKEHYLNLTLSITNVCGLAIENARKHHVIKEANRAILEQQKTLVEEERLKVLLQMAGAAAHELNQPLMILLGNLEIFELVKDDHQEMLDLIPKIKKAGEAISNTVKKIQNVHYDVTVKHDGKTDMIRLNKDINILSVEDSDSVFNLIKTYFMKSNNMKLFRAKTIEETMYKIKEMEFDIILLDYDLPDGTGLDVLEKLNAENIDLPVIAVTGVGNEQVASDFFKFGASDYLSTANINRKKLFEAIHLTLEKYGLKKEIDQSIKIMAESSIKDNLTGLYNRRYFEDILKREVKRAQRYNSDLCCLVLDIDLFKNINDTYGHLCGDFILQEFSQLLEKNKRQSDYIFRYGGEEFVILIPQTGIQGAFQLAEKIRKSCQDKKLYFEGHCLNITVSIGVSSLDKQTTDKMTYLFQNADKALYKAKNNGRNCVEVYNL